jgi:hypothetical protein
MPGRIMASQLGRLYDTLHIGAGQLKILSLSRLPEAQRNAVRGLRSPRIWTILRRPVLPIDRLPGCRLPAHATDR